MGEIGAYSGAMTAKEMPVQSLPLEPEKAAALEKLSASTRIPKEVLLREGVDDLLAKHGEMESEQYDTLRRILLESRKLAGEVMEGGPEEQDSASVERARRLLRDLDQIQDLFDRNWRFSIRGAVDALLTEHKLLNPKRKT